MKGKRFRDIVEVVSKELSDSSHILDTYFENSKKST